MRKAQAELHRATEAEPSEPRASPPAATPSPVHKMEHALERASALILRQREIVGELRRDGRAAELALAEKLLQSFEDAFKVHRRSLPLLRDKVCGPWLPVRTAPFDRLLQLAVIDAKGVHHLEFPCRRLLRAWIDAHSGSILSFQPTHWREWI